MADQIFDDDYLDAEDEELFNKKFRRFDDTTKTRNLIFNNVYNSINKKYPIANKDYTLRVSNLNWDKGNKDFSIDDQKQALFKRRGLYWKLRGDWELVKNADNSIIDRVPNSLIARVPYLTNRGTFIYNGNEYTVANQTRLKSGVFTRLKDNGELEAHFNLIPGSGKSFRIYMEPETGLFKLQAGQAQIPLYPVLKSFGLKDQDIAKYLGADLTNANAAKLDPQANRKVVERLGRNKDLISFGDSPDKTVTDVFSRMQLDPTVTSITLGKPYANINAEVLLRSAQKLLNISKGQEETDDRDSLGFQTFHGPEDFFPERIDKDSGNTARKLLWKATLRQNLSHIGSSILTPQLEAVIIKSGLGQPLEEINPIDILDQQNRIIKTGEGGVSSLDAVPDESRNVQPSHFNYIDPVRSPESKSLGIDSRVSYNAVKGLDNQLYSKFIDARTGKPKYVSAMTAVRRVLAFPDEMTKPGKRVRAMVNGKLRYVDKKQVDLIAPSAAGIFNVGTNLVPMVSSSKGQRAMVAAKMMNQALPLEEGEIPLVQSLLPDDVDRSFEEKFGAWAGATYAEDDGIVTSITPKGISVKTKNGTKTYELFENFPYNRKTMIHSVPRVNVGDRIQKGALLADSNFTKNGSLALGRNLNVAYMPYKGNNYEDAIVVSESAAKKLASLHMYTEKMDFRDGVEADFVRYLSLFPGKFNKKQYDTISKKNGVVKVGTVLNYGDPVVLATKYTKGTPGVYGGKKTSYSDSSVTWKHDAPGVVTDVYHDRDGLKVAIKSFQPLQLGDKLSDRYGAKGVVSMIVPDAQMLKDEEGNTIDLVQNSMGIVSRVNPSQLLETLLGKIAYKTGKSFKVPGFDSNNRAEWISDLLKQHNIKDTETLSDPTLGANGKKIKDIFTGRKFFMKLHHTAESKGSGRGVDFYTSEDLPGRGGEEGSKRISLLEINSLLSNNAVNFLRDSKTIRGQKNEDFWKAYRLGLPTPAPEVPAIFQKFVAQLQGSGINITKQGDKFKILAMTDKDVEQLSNNRKVTTADTYNPRTLVPVKGGIFDEVLTGGPTGNRWAYIQLDDKIPNPIMEEPIRRLLGLTQAKFEAILMGKDYLEGKTGPGAIGAALSNINIDRAINDQQAIIDSGKVSKRDNAVKVLGYLKSAKKNNMALKDFMISKIPVLPPFFRPITISQDLQLINDANYLYKDLWTANQNVADLRQNLGDKFIGEEQLTLYNAVKAISGLADPVHRKNKEKGVRGLLTQVFGSSPKSGAFQSKVLGMAVDLVGRGVITPNADLDMDHVGIPEDKAWKIYTPFIMRRLVRAGMKAQDAVKAIANQDPAARKMLVMEMEHRPVVINRAPSLHRYSLIGAYPVITKGDTLQISPIVTAGLGADFDGDAMNYHVPVSEDAVQEVKDKLMPSKNLVSPATFDVHYLPRQEFIMGLYAASKKRKEKEPRIFASKADVIKAFKRGEIDHDDPVVVKD